MAWAVFNTEDDRRVTKAHSTRIAALVEAFEAGMVLQGGMPDFPGHRRHSLFLVSPYALAECDDEGNVGDYDPITKMADKVITGNVNMRTALTVLEGSLGQDWDLIKAKLLSRIGDRL